MIREALERRRRAGGHQRRRQRVRDRARPRVAAPAGGARAARLAARARSAALTAFLGWPAERLAQADDDAGRGRTCTAGCTTGRGCCARAAWPRCSRRSTLTRGRCRARVLAERRRRAQAHRPAPRRPAAARRRLEEQLGATALDRLAAHAGSPRPTTTLPTRSAAGGWSPTPRRSRFSPSTAARASSSRSSTCPFLWEPGYIPDRPPRPVFFHDPEAGDERTIDVALEGSDFAPPAPAVHPRAARRGPAPGLRRPDPRPPSGRRVVGGVLRQPQLAAGAAAVRPRRRTVTSPPSGSSPPSDQAVVAASGARCARAAPGAHQRRALAARGCRRAWRPPRPTPRRAGRVGVRRAASTCAGGARPTATSPPPAMRPGWPASPRSR